MPEVGEAYNGCCEKFIFFLLPMPVLFFYCHIILMYSISINVAAHITITFKTQHVKQIPKLIKLQHMICIGTQT